LDHFSPAIYLFGVMTSKVQPRHNLCAGRIFHGCGRKRAWPCAASGQSLWRASSHARFNLHYLHIQVGSISPATLPCTARIHRVLSPAERRSLIANAASAICAQRTTPGCLPAGQRVQPAFISFPILLKVERRMSRARAAICAQSHALQFASALSASCKAVTKKCPSGANQQSAHSANHPAAYRPA
jgi:hypothetical protein